MQDLNWFFFVEIYKFPRNKLETCIARDIVKLSLNEIKLVYSRKRRKKSPGTNNISHRRLFNMQR